LNIWLLLAVVAVVHALAVVAVQEASALLQDWQLRLARHTP